MAQNWSGAGTGALSGAATGAAIGSVVPGVGTAIGAAGGGLLGAMAGFLSPGNKDKFKQVPRFTKEQQNLLNQYIQQLQGGGLQQNYGLSNDYLRGILSGSPEAYQRFAAPYQQQFESQTIPRLAERFGALGGGLGGGVAGSSGFGQAVGGAGAQFNSQLAQAFEQMRMQAAQQAMGQYNQLGSFALTPSFENVYQPGTLGFGASALSGISQGIGQGLGQYGAYNMFNQGGMGTPMGIGG